MSGLATLMAVIDPVAARDLQSTESLLSERLGIAEWTRRRAACVILDTFDRHLLGAGEVLEWVGGADAELRWRVLDGGEVRWRWRAQRRPGTAAALGSGNPARALALATEGRALLPLVSTRVAISVGELRNQDERPVCMLEIWRWQGATRVLLVPLRGYRREARRSARVLVEARQLAPPDPGQPLPLAVERERLWRDAAPGWAVDLEPDLHTDLAVKRVLGRYAAVMRANEAGMRADLDDEFLHDFRVAVRRTRSLLTQVKGVFPRPRVRRFQREWAALGTVTGPARDADVFVADLDGLVARLDVDRAHAHLRIGAILAERRARARASLVGLIDSAGYRRMFDDWIAFLEAPTPRRSRLRRAALPVAGVARERIAKMRRRSLREGGEVRPDGPVEAVHELRKTCKRLRYLIDAFRGVLDADEVTRALVVLKEFQDYLGKYNDLHVQIGVISEIEAELRRVGERGDRRLLRSVDGLLEVLRAREQELRQGLAARFAAYAGKRTSRRFAALCRTRKP